MTHLGLLLAALLLGIAAPAEAQSQSQINGKRVALVIGNGSYRSVEPLANAANDARLIATTLRKLNFILVGGGAQLDLDRAHMAAAVEQFGHMLSGADVGLFYYSGHGLQVSGVNWLVPVDANPRRPKDLDFQMIDADLVLRQMDGAGTRLNLVLLDACRNNPFAIGGLRAVQGGLAEMRAPEGTLIAYATQPGNVALDGDGNDSPYTTALAKIMQQPGLDIFRMFNQVGLEVKRATAGNQQPWVSNSPIDGEFYFVGTAKAAPPVVVGPPTAPLIAATAPTAPSLVVAASAGVIVKAPPLEVPAQPQSQLMQLAGLVHPLILPAPSVPPSAGAPAANAADPLVAMAHARPCAVLDARQVDDHVDVYGLAARGSDWDGFLRQVGNTRGVRAEAFDVDFLPPFACAPVDVLAAVVRASRDEGGQRLLTLGQRQVTSAQILVVTLHGAAGKTVLLDLYRADDLVDHLKVQPVASSGGEMRVSIAPAADTPPGPRVLTALISAVPLDLGFRPVTERASVYLATLRQVVRTAVGVRADMAPFELKPVVARAGVSTGTTTAPSRCNAIMERAQLGETLPDAVRAYLRTQCR